MHLSLTTLFKEQINSFLKMTEANNNTKKSKKNAGGFQSMGLSEEIYKGIVKMGFRVPTPVQRKSLPVILAGNDTVVMARTGSGKTAAFCIPLLERLVNSQRRKQQVSSSVKFSAGAVILSPTRELSLQTLKVLQTLSTYIVEPRLNCIGINGGESMEKQFALLSSNPDVIVATPGRLAHHLSEIPDFHLRHCEMVVFDEADRLFEMGFSMQIREICKAMPSSESGRQTLLFSATMPKILVEFTKSGIMDTDPQVVRLDKDATVSEELRIGFITIRSQEKDAALLHLLTDVLPDATQTDSSSRQNEKSKHGNSKEQGAKRALGLTLIFAATRHHVDYLRILINNSGIGNTGNYDDIATSIYGSMDQEARKLNLAAFKSGRTPILIVTDVAARGIDIPLIDHVIHYSFPPSAKLFVHRSGRAARAGRIGYCWGLVDPEEMPYMVDLYLFLGRKLSTGQEKECKDQNDSADIIDNNEVVYSLTEMTPDMVHYGSVPESTMTAEVENVRRIVDSELTGSHDAEILRSLIRVCNNAMKQYRRSRPEASKQGVKRAKEILEGQKEQNGKRTGGGTVSVHPVLRKVEIDRIMGSGDVAEETALKRLQELKQREDMLKELSTFRPKETVFEAFATGGTKITGVLSQVDKGRTVNGGMTKKYDASAAFTAMKGMRRQMSLANQKGTSLVVAGSERALLLNGELEIPSPQDEVNSPSVSLLNDPIISNEKGNVNSQITEKRRLSKAERKRMKKGESKVTLESSADSSSDKRDKDKRGTDFRDSAFYIDTLAANTEDDNRSRHIEAAMQPSAADGKSGMASALRLEEAMLDIVGDENADFVKKQRITRWDKSKRKYVQTTIGMETSGMSKTKKLKLESGQLVKNDKLKLGELYEKWQKKTNKSIGRVGVFDDVNAEDDAGAADPSGYARKTKVNKSANKLPSDGLKTASQIRKKREADKKQKIKNMPKRERAQLFANKRAAQKKMAAESAAKGKGWQGKKGFSGRYV